MTVHHRQGFTSDLRLRRGFTLVELMVVIAVIAVLLGLLVVGLQGMRSQASAADCANNLQQIGLALQQYRTAGDMPPKAIELKEKLAPFLKDQISRLYRCTATNNDVVYGANFCLERFQPGDNKIALLDATQFDVPFMGGSDAEFRSIVDPRHKGTANVLYYNGSVTRLAIDPINPYDPVSGSANVVNH